MRTKFVDVYKYEIEIGHDHCDACGDILPNASKFAHFKLAENEIYFKLCNQCLEDLGSKLFPIYLRILPDDILDYLYDYYRQDKSITVPVEANKGEE